MTVKLKTPSNGSVSLTPQDTASDVVLTVPAGTSTVVTNATLPTQLNATGSAPIYACRAWVNFNGTGTVAIRASGNVSSITDSGTGIYVVNFTTAMPDANYSVVAFSAQQLGGVSFVSGLNAAPPATSSVGIYCVNNNTGADLSTVCVSVFR